MGEFPKSSTTSVEEMVWCEAVAVGIGLLTPACWGSTHIPSRESIPDPGV